MQVLQSRVLVRPRDFDASVAFYEDQLGLVRYRDWGDPLSGVVYFLGGGFLELTDGWDDEETTAPTAGLRLWLQVADLQATAAELDARGVVLDQAPERKPWGLLEATLRDPDGLELVLVETPVDHPLRRRQ